MDYICASVALKIHALHTPAEFPETVVTFTCQFPSMRNICILVTILLFTACTKEADEESYISYTGPDGKEVRFSGNRVAQGAGVSGVRAVLNSTRFVYMIDGYSETPSSNMYFALDADSLRPGTYSNASLADNVRFSIRHNSVAYYCWRSPEKPFAITISRHSNGSVSGTFEGKLYIHTSPQPTDSIIVTGKINNVYLHYK
jgi:hypothetical protein